MDDDYLTSLHLNRFDTHVGILISILKCLKSETEVMCRDEYGYLPSRKTGNVHSCFDLLSLLRKKVSFDRKLCDNLFHRQFIVDNLFHVGKGKILRVATQGVESKFGPSQCGAHALEILNIADIFVHARECTKSNTSPSAGSKEPTGASIKKKKIGLDSLR